MAIGDADLGLQSAGHAGAYLGRRMFSCGWSSRWKHAGSVKPKGELRYPCMLVYKVACMVKKTPIVVLVFSVVGGARMQMFSSIPL